MGKQQIAVGKIVEGLKSLNIEFTSGPGGAIYGKTPDMQRREVLLALPRGIVGVAHAQAAREFLRSTYSRLRRTQSETQVMRILEQAEQVLGEIASSSRFPGSPVPRAPW